MKPEAATFLPKRSAGDIALAESTGIETCDTLEGLDAIARPEVELVVWRRALPPRLIRWLAELSPDRLPDFRLLLRPENLVEAIEPLLDQVGLSKGEEPAILRQDIERLVGAFARIARTDLVDLRLERTETDACWKFHRDRVEARLIATYRGPATEWVRPEHADAALRDQRNYTGPVERLRGQDVAVFKGNCAKQGLGIVHRSPPIAGTGQTRLLLCLNKPSLASPDPWAGRSKGTG